MSTKPRFSLDLRLTGRTIPLAALVVFLGGCSVMHNLGLYHGHSAADQPEAQQAMADPAPATPPDQAVLAPEAPLTEAGRAAMSAGNTAAALDYFRRALAMAEPRAPALNGLGVGYTRIGRNDLALQYFNLAVQADIENPRYAQNLALLVNSLEAPAKALAALPVSPLAAPVTPAKMPQLAGQIEQVAPHEFHIHSAALASRPDEQQRLAIIEQRFRPVVTIPLSSRVAASSSSRSDQRQFTSLEQRFQPLVAIRLPEPVPAPQKAEGQRKIVAFGPAQP